MVCWEIAMKASNGFKLLVTATPGFHSQYDWHCQIMWLYPGVPDNAEDDTLMETHGAEAFDTTIKSVMHAIQTEDKDAQREVAQWMIQIAKPWTIRSSLESRLAN